MCNGGGDPNDTNQTPLKTMTFRLSRQFTEWMNQMDESDAELTGKSFQDKYIKSYRKFWEQLDGTDRNDLITINQRLMPLYQPEMTTDITFYTNINAGRGDDIIVHNHADQTDVYDDVRVSTVSKVTVWGGEGTDSFIVNGDHSFFVVKDMEVGETFTVDEKYIHARGSGKVNSEGRSFYNFEDKSGNDSRNVGAWIPEGTALQFSKDPNGMSIFTLVEV